MTHLWHWLAGWSAQLLVASTTLLLIWWAIAHLYRKQPARPEPGCRNCGTPLRGGLHCPACGVPLEQPPCEPDAHKWVLLTESRDSWLLRGRARWCSRCETAQLMALTGARTDAGVNLVDWRTLPLDRVLASAERLDKNLLRGLGLIK